MPKLKTLSGKELVSFFEKFGFSVISKKGSHCKIGKIIENKEKQILIIPLRKEVPKGTLKAIYKQASFYLSEEELKEYFYTK